MDSKTISSWRLIDSKFSSASVKGIGGCLGSKLSKCLAWVSFKPNTVLATSAAWLNSEPLAPVAAPLRWSAMALIKVDNHDSATTNEVMV